MTPLSDALTAAQRSALAALEKAYVAEALDPDAMVANLDSCGISDPIDVAFLLASLDVLREWGVSAPTMSERVTEAKDTSREPLTTKQADYIVQLGTEKNQDVDLNFTPTKAQASEIIEQLKAGTYNAETWRVGVCPRCEYDLTGEDPERDARDAREATESDVERTNRCLPS